MERYQEILARYLNVDLPRYMFAPSMHLISLLERLARREQELADMTADYHRWHDAFMELKYPGGGKRIASQSDRGTANGD